MSTPNLPWDINFAPPGVDPNLVKTITDAVTGAVSEAEQVIPTVVAAGGSLANQIGSASLPAELPVPPTGAVALPGGLGQVVENSIEGAVKAAQIQIAERVQGALTQALSGLGEPQVATIPSGDLKRIDAWERAGRTFLTGLVVTVLAGIIQVIGQAASTGADFFSKDGWNAVITLAVGSVVSSVFTYILRYVKEPAGAALNTSTKS